MIKFCSESESLCFLVRCLSIQSPIYLISSRKIIFTRWNWRWSFSKYWSFLHRKCFSLSQVLSLPDSQCGRQFLRTEVVFIFAKKWKRNVVGEKFHKDQSNSSTTQEYTTKFQWKESFKIHSKITSHHQEDLTSVISPKEIGLIILRMHYSERRSHRSIHLLRVVNSGF